VVHEVVFVLQPGLQHRSGDVGFGCEGVEVALEGVAVVELQEGVGLAEVRETRVEHLVEVVARDALTAEVDSLLLLELGVGMVWVRTRLLGCCGCGRRRRCLLAVSLPMVDSSRGRIDGEVRGTRRSPRSRRVAGGCREWDGRGRGREVGTRG
jgi:hypothetical protein